MFRLSAHIIVLVIINLLLCLNALRESWNGRLITLKNVRVLVSVCNTLCTGVVIPTLRLNGCLLLISAMLQIRCESSGNSKDNLYSNISEG
jgi:hypothetical protein